MTDELRSTWWPGWVRETTETAIVRGTNLAPVVLPSEAQIAALRERVGDLERTVAELIATVQELTGSATDG